MKVLIDNMKFLTIALICLLPSVSLASTCSECHARETVKINEEVIVTAKKYLYVREKTNNNDAPEIDAWVKYARASKGDPWCAAFVVSMYKETYEQYGLKSPVPRMASVSSLTEYATKHPFEFKVISTKKINWGVDKPLIGDMVSWKHGSSTFTGFGYKGHFGLDKSCDPKMNVYTVEGNTKSGPGGDQSGTVKGDLKYGHEGVFERKRSLGLQSNFPIMFFIRIKNNEL
jgi:hypothetical protein